VVGSNNSAFDICGALREYDADVTMVQRSSTHIVNADPVGKVWGLGSDTLHQSRHYSLYLALQLKARYEGLDTPGVRAGRGAPRPVSQRAG
jgi:cation diffusion facilitator CzcD-associated flavoprotein CzcO